MRIRQRYFRRYNTEMCFKQNISVVMLSKKERNKKEKGVYFFTADTATFEKTKKCENWYRNF